MCIDARWACECLCVQAVEEAQEELPYHDLELVTTMFALKI